MRHPTPRPGMSFVAAGGALLAAAAVALAAYAAHAASPAAQMRLYTAAAFAFGHGAMLAAVAPATAGRCARTGMFAMLVGSLLFAGSLALAAFVQAPTTLAPTGGVMLIGAWLLLAIDRLGY